MANMVGFGNVRMVGISACISIVYRLGMPAINYDIVLGQESLLIEIIRFVLKTKEQRAAEKALMDKSPLNTLTLEDFLESERHKLSGTLTPVTEESFAKWKKERMDKKAAEEEAKKLKDATGRALFEKGDWNESEDEEGDDTGAWNLEALRRETEAARLRKEEDRLAAISDVDHGNMISIGVNG